MFPFYACIWFLEYIWNKSFLNFYFVSLKFEMEKLFEISQNTLLLIFVLRTEFPRSYSMHVSCHDNSATHLFLVKSILLVGMLFTSDDRMSLVYQENHVPCSIFLVRSANKNVRSLASTTNKSCCILYSYHCLNFTIVFRFNNLVCGS